MFLGVRAGGGREFARLPGIERGLATDAGFRLLPDQVGKFAGDPGTLDEGVSHVDIKLEGDGKFVVHQPGGDEHALRAA